MTKFFGDPPQVIERCYGTAGELQLQKRDKEYEIIYNGVFIMATYNGASEKKAVNEALNKMISDNKANSSLKVLIAGLGVGYSLCEALSFEEVIKATVVEIEPTIIRWNQTIFNQINKNALSDSRVELINSDFSVSLQESRSKTDLNKLYHLVMVDTDNGSSWLSRPANEFFYSTSGLKRIKYFLHTGGAVCFWCSRRENLFESRLEKEFGNIYFRSILEKTGHEGCYYLAFNNPT